MTRAVFFGVQALLCLSLLFATVDQAAAQTRVSSISVDGNQRIPDSTVVRLMDFQPGQTVSNDDINDAVQRIMASGLFETADVQPVGGGLRVTVVERPTVNRINIAMNCP